MSVLVDRALGEAGLLGVLEARRAGTLAPSDVARLQRADLLALGALADRVRSLEVGDAVPIHTAVSGEVEEGVVVLPREDEDLTGLELLREVAIMRITGPDRASIRVDWTRCGLELAQIALGFGANELSGRIGSKRGLPIAAGELAGVGKKSGLLPAHVVKQRELAGLVRRAGRVPAFIHADGAADSADDGHALQEAPQ